MPECRVIVQARTASSRLPAKCLLPVAGYPAAILAALRVAHPGWQTLLATSDDPSDDHLSHLGEAAGLTVARGPLSDVLSRFLLAVQGLPDDGVVVRLTADNLFPDALLLREVVDEFVRSEHPYLITWSPSLDAPHGLVAEVFRAGTLREAAAKAASASDREHVTPWIRRVYGIATHRPRGMPRGYGRLRCTMDTLEDYLRIASLFRGAADPVRISWIELCARLEKEPDLPRFLLPAKIRLGEVHSSLVLGTAQLGGAYGIANASGAPSEDEAVELVRAAIRHGVTHVDTARAYGASERRIGAALSGGRGADAHIVTKLAPLDAVGDDATRRFLTSLVDASVFRSCRELRRSTLPTLLVHRASDRIRWNGAVWKRLLSLRDQGVIDRLGVSAATPEEAIAALEDPEVRLVQIPFNILDGRWKEAGVDEAAMKRLDVIVHGRSPLLQGLLASANPDLWPRVPGVDPRSILNKLNTLARELQRESLLDLAFAYARSHPWIHGVVAGFEKIKQLMEAVRLFTRPELESDEIEYVESQRELCPPSLLDPSRWPR